MSDQQRISIQYKHRFSTSSEAGKVFAWLKESYGETTDEMIACAVKVLLLPIALADRGESEAVVRAAIKRSQYIFEEKMRAAAEPFIGNELKVNCGNGNGHRPKAILAPLMAHGNGAVSGNHEAPPVSNQFQAVPEDEFELDESKIFDDTNHFGGIHE